jgi:hypothetical protein
LISFVYRVHTLCWAGAVGHGQTGDRGVVVLFEAGQEATPPRLPTAAWINEPAKENINTEFVA